MKWKQVRNDNQWNENKQYYDYIHQVDGSNPTINIHYWNMWSDKSERWSATRWFPLWTNDSQRGHSEVVGWLDELPYGNISKTTIDIKHSYS